MSALLQCLASATSDMPTLAATDFMGCDHTKLYNSFRVNSRTNCHSRNNAAPTRAAQEGRFDQCLRYFGKSMVRSDLCTLIPPGEEEDNQDRDTR